MNLRKVYEYALQREREGRDFFERNAKRMSHAAATGIFLTLVAEEEKHIATIQGLLSALESGRAGEARPEGELAGHGFFSERAASEDLDQTVIESMIPDVTILRMAYLIERDFAEFYEMSAKRVEDKTAKKSLQMLGRWERQHEKLFKMMHDKAFEEYASMPWGG